MGRATALALAAAGARVIVHYGRNADEAKAVVDRIRAPAAAPTRSPPISPRPTAPIELAAQVRDLIGGRPRHPRRECRDFERGDDSRT